MTPEQAIQKQCATGSITCTEKHIEVFDRNRAMYNMALEDAYVKFGQLSDQQAHKLANKLFGRFGEMRSRYDPEANAWRKVSKPFLHTCNEQ